MRAPKAEDNAEGRKRRTQTRLQACSSQRTRGREPRARDEAVLPKQAAYLIVHYAVLHRRQPRQSRQTAAQCAAGWSARRPTAKAARRAQMSRARQLRNEHSQLACLHHYQTVWYGNTAAESPRRAAACRPAVAPTAEVWNDLHTLVPCLASGKNSHPPYKRLAIRPCQVANISHLTTCLPT